jgi:signal peptidase I
MIALVHGDSMKPALKGWSIVSIKKIDRKLKVGDIILYESIGFNRNGMPTGHKENVLHRIHGLREDGKIEVKGDNRSYIEVIRPERIRGILGAVIW